MRAGENHRPPRYRLLTAAAALPQRDPARPRESFERDCPACGHPVEFTQVQTDDGMTYAIADHDCREALAPPARGHHAGMKHSKAEADVDPDPARADSRDDGGVENPDAADQGSTTGTTPSGEYVGRVAGNDAADAGESGAERRAQAED